MLINKGLLIKCACVHDVEAIIEREMFGFSVS